MTTLDVIAVVAVTVDVAFRLIALVIVPRNRRPQTSMAWLLAIFLIPYVAFLAFLAFGSHRLSPTRRRKQATINDYLRHWHALLPEAVQVHSDELRRMRSLPDWVPSVVQMTEDLGHIPMVRGNTLEFLPDYEPTLRRMVEDIDRAEFTVHVLFYIMSVDSTTDEFFAALERAHRRGVEVRVLYDQVATRRIRGSAQVPKRLRNGGIEFYPMLPFQPWQGVYQRPDLRNHRKILVIDSAVAFTGSQNIIESGYRDTKHLKRGLHWLDLMVRVEGPLVSSLEALFVTDWYQETDTILPLTHSQAKTSRRNKGVFAQVVPSGPAFDGENNLRVFNVLMYGARKNILIVSPYLVPDDSMRYAITSAALRGVQVDVVVSEIGDQPLVFHAQRSYYDELLAAGVRIWLYPAPTILHSKFVVVDEAVAVMGTSNLDMRSFTLNLELTLLLLGDKAITPLTKLGRDYIARSRQLDREEWATRPALTQIIEGLARLTATVQ